jgi:hypothetical protein
MMSGSRGRSGVHVGTTVEEDAGLFQVRRGQIGAVTSASLLRFGSAPWFSRKSKRQVGGEGIAENAASQQARRILTAGSAFPYHQATALDHPLRLFAEAAGRHNCAPTLGAQGHGLRSTQTRSQTAGPNPTGEIPRLCRGGSNSLTVPAMRLFLPVRRSDQDGPRSVAHGLCLVFGCDQAPFEGPARGKAPGSAGGSLRKRNTSLSNTLNRIAT